ncbi:CLIP-associating protein 1-like isoform X8 [Haliotis rufescens]|uniref:CLIP-associating protein 1-like isoform X8 n=1 Tax=Haliotis rufescens TaxID=6454 RepID=UPI00201F0E9C|nr:CLIP-associating protein 1-like isoform X8 [Haliotis rufescens]
MPECCVDSPHDNFQMERSDLSPFRRTGSLRVPRSEGTLQTLARCDSLRLPRNGGSPLTRSNSLRVMGRRQRSFTQPEAPLSDKILEHLMISVNGLEVLCLMVDRMGEEFKPHVTSVLPAVIDRLGDSKDQVREKAQDLLLKLMMPASSPQYVFERLTGAFSHKLWHVREGVLVCLQNTINRYGARCLQLSKLVPAICKLLEDQSGPVREAAVNALTEIYRHVGERVRSDLQKKGVSAQRLKHIFQKFDEQKLSGNMVATADMMAPSRSDRSEDETDFAKPMTSKVLHTKRPITSTGTLGRKSITSAKGSGTSAQLAYKRKRSGSATSVSGGVDEELFIKSFEDVPKVSMYSARDLQDNIKKIEAILNDPSKDWEKRNDSMKQLRSLIVNGAAEYDDFFQLLRTLEPCFMLAVKDLRSQVVREACITVAYLAKSIGHKADHLYESLFPHLFNLIPNGAKVMSTSGIVCIRFIIQFSHSSRLIPIITGTFSSKSNVIRRFTCEFLNQLLHTWPTHSLEKHIAILQDCIKRGISDADSEARAFSRKGFWGFAEHFRDQADALLNTLDSSKQKMLQGELSNSSSNNSLNSDRDTLKVASKARPRSHSTDRTDSGTLSRTASARRSGAARISSSRSDAGGDSDFEVDLDIRRAAAKPYQSPYAQTIIRSSSAADLSGTNGSPTKPRSSSMLMATRLAKGSTNSLPRQKSSSMSSKTVTSLVTPDRSRSRSRIGVSQSQPNSRSGSPSSRLGYITHNSGRVDPMASGRPRKSGIPRSQGTSREGSPSRHTYGRERRLSGSKVSHGSKGAVMAQRLLRPGSDVEDALFDALQRGPAKKRFDTYDSDDNASETSSVCSERSYNSYSGRTSEADSDMDRRHRHPKVKQQSLLRYSPNTVVTEEDMQEIIAQLGSGSYTERKEGLISLQHLLRMNRYLSRVELKKVTEIFTRMFHDPHSKVFSIFLDTLVELIGLHCRDLLDWLYILLTRLLNKTGADMLGSVYAKLQKALDTVRENFPSDHQFNTITKFIIDSTQSPNLKVKIAMLHYLNSLIIHMASSDFVNTMDVRLAVSRIITWTTEPKNTEVRKAAQLVLIGLFNLNAPEFSLMLSALPKAFQDGATKILHNHIRTTSEPMDVLSPRNAASPGQQRSRPPSRSSIGHPDEFETENLNPEDIYNSIKKTSADIQNLSINSKLDHYDDIKKKREFTSQDSGIQDLRNDSPDAVDGGKRSLHYNPSHYQEEVRNRNAMNGYNNKLALAEAVYDGENDFFNKGSSPDQGELISEILNELSNHNERNSERQKAMITLMEITRDDQFGLWDEHFKTILLILLETLGDNDSQIRALAIKVLREILKKQPDRFKDYSELTILRILEAHKDPAKEVVLSAEACADTLSTAIPAEQCMRILNQIVQTAHYPVILAGIKMQTKVVERLDKEILERMLADVVPGLLRGYDAQESMVRKASVFCLVAIHLGVGEVLRPYLQELSGSKMKLLNLYIKKAQAQKDDPRSVQSPVMSDT